MTSELKPWPSNIKDANNCIKAIQDYLRENESPRAAVDLETAIVFRESQIKREMIEKVKKGVEEAMDKADYPDDVATCVQEYLNSLLKEQP